MQAVLRSVGVAGSIKKVLLNWLHVRATLVLPLDLTRQIIVLSAHNPPPFFDHQAVGLGLLCCCGVERRIGVLGCYIRFLIF